MWEGGTYLVIVRPWRSISAFNIPIGGVDGMHVTRSYMGHSGTHSWTSFSREVSPKKLEAIVLSSICLRQSWSTNSAVEEGDGQSTM